MRRSALAAGSVAKVGARAGRDNPVALLEISDAVGERRERQSVRAEIRLALAVADRKRRALPRPDQEIVLALEKVDEGEGAAHPLERRVNGLGRRPAARASSSSTTKAAISESVWVWKA